MGPVTPPIDTGRPRWHSRPVSRTVPITLVDHGAGNLRSVVRALRHVGADVRVTADPADVARAERIVVPGQGAFADCMRRLQAAGLDDAVREHLRAERPYLGICLGLQVLFDQGHEHGVHRGLGVLRGACVPLPPSEGLKIPHMGWNQVHAVGGAAPVFSLPGDVADGAWFYFVHSYHVAVAEPLARAETQHGAPFVSAVRRGNLVACQFHPEKSHDVGLALLEGFLDV